MYLLLLDETNSVQATQSQYFIYGGIFFHAKNAEDLNKGIEKIKHEYGYSRENDFKFDTKSKPRELSVTDFAKAKNAVLNLAIKYEVRFIAYLVHHSIARKKILEDKITWASNEVIEKFDVFLHREKETGICFFDWLPFKNQSKFLTRLFKKGVSTASNNTLTVKERILMYAEAPGGASNLSSLSDIILGSFRFCVNNNANHPAFKAIMPSIQKLFYRFKAASGQESILEYGFLLRPIITRYYEHEYAALISKLGVTS